MHVNKPRGFTLIELVVGIVVFSIALMLFTSLIVPQAVRSVDPIFQVRATELAQSLINEIVSKPFDENSNRTGGTARCNEDLSVPSD
ncbi:MAG: MSHA pilin protein MshD, partial [Colwellia sp.]